MFVYSFLDVLEQKKTRGEAGTVGDVAKEHADEDLVVISVDIESAEDPNPFKQLGPMRSDSPEPLSLSAAASAEPGIETGISVILDEGDSILGLLADGGGVTSSDGITVNPVVNKNNNEYTYSLNEGDVTLVFKCDKNDEGKVITAVLFTAKSGGEKSFTLTFAPDKVVNVTVNVPYRVNDDTAAAAVGDSVSLAGNDYITSKAKVTLCTEAGADVPKQTMTNDDGSTTDCFEPAEGLKVSLSGDGSVTILEGTADGTYTFYYYAKEPGKNGKSFYKDDANTPATVTLTVDSYANYKVKDDEVKDCGGNRHKEQIGHKWL